MQERFSVTLVDGDPVEQRATEFVERKGVGHPDSLCDGIAEAVSRRLSRFYRGEYGRVLHHNTDKVYLGAGRAEPEFGGGRVVEPLYVLVGGRATTSVDGDDLPVDDLATTAAREYLLDTVPELHRPTRSLRSLLEAGGSTSKLLTDAGSRLHARSVGRGPRSGRPDRRGCFPARRPR